MTFEDDIAQRIEEDEGPQVVGPLVRAVEHIPLVNRWTRRLLDWVWHRVRP